MDIDSPGMLRHEASGICLLADVIAKSALKCGAQVTGRYFSDPGFKDVPEPWNLAFPIAEVESDGSAVITLKKSDSIACASRIFPANRAHRRSKFRSAAGKVSSAKICFFTPALSPAK